MRGRSGTDRGRVVRVTKDLAFTINQCLQRKAEYPVCAFEEDGHLQGRLIDVQPSGDRRTRGPHRLRDYRTPIHQAAVKYPTIWRVWRSRDMGRDRIDEEIALSEGGSKHGNGGALQQIQKVLLGCLTLEGLGYVPVDEKRS